VNDVGDAEAARAMAQARILLAGCGGDQ
jgi:hypothetical protein